MRILFVIAILFCNTGCLVTHYMHTRSVEANNAAVRIHANEGGLVAAVDIQQIPGLLDTMREKPIQCALETIVVAGSAYLIKEEISKPDKKTTVVNEAPIPQLSGKSAAQARDATVNGYADGDSKQISIYNAGDANVYNFCCPQEE